MGLKTQETSIANRRTMMTEYPALTALDLGMRLAKLFGTVIGSALVNDTSDETVVNVITSGLLSSIHVPEVMTLVKDLLRGVVVIDDSNGDSAAITLDTDVAVNRVFNGNLPALIETVKTVVGFNFSDFFVDASATPSATEVVGGTK